jgi:hypothetical protein
MTTADNRNGSNVLTRKKREFSDGRSTFDIPFFPASPGRKNGIKARFRPGENLRKRRRFHEKVTERDNRKF